MTALERLPAVEVADVYKDGQLAATLSRTADGVRFAYLPEYVKSRNPPVATTLPLHAQPPPPRPGGALPPFFTGLLPEGRRFSALHRAVKTSKDDELSLLLAVGLDLVGDVLVVAQGDPSPFSSDGRSAAVSAGGPSRRSDELDFDLLRVEHGVIDSAGIAGVQDKVSMRTITLPLRLGGRHPYLVKLNPPEYPLLVENEATTLDIARRLRGLTVARSRVVHDQKGQAGLLLERFDRARASASSFRHLPVEDATQVADLYPSEKYRISAEEAVDRLARLCAAGLVARRNLYLQFVWAWLSGNGDLHAKNLSILGDGRGEWRVAPVYDIPSTLPYGDVTGMALTIGGRRDGLSRRRFLAFAGDIGLPRVPAERAIAEALRVGADLLTLVEAGRFPTPPQTTAKKLARQLKARRKAIE